MFIAFCANMYSNLCPRESCNFPNILKSVLIVLSFNVALKNQVAAVTFCTGSPTSFI